MKVSENRNLTKLEPFCRNFLRYKFWSSFNVQILEKEFYCNFLTGYPMSFRMHKLFFEISVYSTSAFRDIEKMIILALKHMERNLTAF